MFLKENIKSRNCFLTLVQNLFSVKVEPLFKTVSSAFANAQNLKNKDEEALQSKELYVQGVRVDAGTIVTYFKPGSRGKSKVQRKRFSHIEVVLGKKN